MDEAVIYGLRRSPRCLPFYVGSTTRDPLLRVREHRYGRRWCTWNPRLAKLLEKGMPDVVILERCPVGMRHQAERKWIRTGRSAGWPVVNILPRGGL